MFVIAQMSNSLIPIPNQLVWEQDRKPHLWVWRHGSIIFGRGRLNDCTDWTRVEREEMADDTITTQPTTKRKEIEQFVRDLDPLQVQGRAQY